MTHPCIDVADAVVARLNAASDGDDLSQKISAQRSYIPNIDLKNIDGVVVHVIPRGITSANVTRAHDQEEPSVTVVVFKKLDGTEPNDVDPMLNLMQEIAGVLRVSLDAANAGWAGRASDPILDVGALQESNLFHSETAFTYRKISDVRIQVG